MERVAKMRNECSATADSRVNDIGDQPYKYPHAGQYTMHIQTQINTPDCQQKVALHTRDVRGSDSSPEIVLAPRIEPVWVKYRKHPMDLSPR
jgi:hypothetical protein